MGSCVRLLGNTKYVQREILCENCALINFAVIAYHSLFSKLNQFNSILRKFVIFVILFYMYRNWKHKANASRTYYSYHKQLESLNSIVIIIIPPNNLWASNYIWFSLLLSIDLSLFLVNIWCFYSNVDLFKSRKYRWSWSIICYITYTHSLDVNP